MRDDQVIAASAASDEVRRKRIPPGARAFRLAAGLVLLAMAMLHARAEITVQDKGEGGDYMSGAPVKLPAAALSTNLFGEDVRPIQNRKHTVRPAVFDPSGALSSEESGKRAPFPEYLKGNPYVWFLQEVRHYTNYACTVTVNGPVTFYLLVDNRVNDFGDLSKFDDPVFGPPDTEWVLQDKWSRVNTGISPQVEGSHRPDYLQVYEGGINEAGIQAVNQFYAIYSKTFTNGGKVTLRTQYQGNMYCLVIATNKPPPTVREPLAPKPEQARTGGQ
jgi:hypothetical protein